MYIDDFNAVRAGLIPYTIKNGKLVMLFMKPSDPAYGGSQFQIAKGHQEEGEDLAVTAMREASEELGISDDNIEKPLMFVGIVGTIHVYAGRIINPKQLSAVTFETGARKWLTPEQFASEGRGIHKAVVQLAADKISKLDEGMNLYKLSATPEELPGFDKQDEIPALMWDKCTTYPRALKKREALWAQDPQTAYKYARRVLKTRFPAGENAIASDPALSELYARYVIKGRWPKGEPAIVKDPICCYDYVHDILGVACKSNLVAQRYLRSIQKWYDPISSLFIKKQIDEAVEPFRSIRPGSKYEKRIVYPGDIKEVPPKVPRTKMSPEEKAAKVAERKKKRDTELWRVWYIVQDGVSNAIPDGDPIEYIRPRICKMYGFGRDEWPEKLMKILDTAARHCSDSRSYNDYLADAWDNYNENDFEEPQVMDLYKLTDKPEELPGYEERDEIMKAMKPFSTRVPPANPWR